MSAAIRAELRKVLTTRLWWVLLLVMVGAIALLAGSLALAFALGDGASVDGETPLDGTALALTVYTAGLSLAYVFPLALGALMVTAEFRHGTVAATVLVEPRRRVLVLAKAAAAVPFGLLYGLVSAATSLAVGAAALTAADTGPMLDAPEVWRALGLSVVAMAVWMLVGVGFGTMVTNQVVVVVALLAWTQLAEPILRLAMGMWGPTEQVAKFLPGAAGEAIAGASFYSEAGLASLLPAWAGAVVLLAYGAVAAVVGARTTLRRDLG